MHDHKMVATFPAFTSFYNQVQGRKQESSRQRLLLRPFPLINEGLGVGDASTEANTLGLPSHFFGWILVQQLPLDQSQKGEWNFHACLKINHISLAGGFTSTEPYCHLNKIHLLNWERTGVDVNQETMVSEPTQPPFSLSSSSALCFSQHQSWPEAHSVFICCSLGVPLTKMGLWEILWLSMVKTWHFCCQGTGLITGQEANILQVAQYNQKQKNFCKGVFLKSKMGLCPPCLLMNPQNPWQYLGINKYSPNESVLCE